MATPAVVEIREPWLVGFCVLRVSSGSSRYPMGLSVRQAGVRRAQLLQKGPPSTKQPDSLSGARETKLHSHDD